VTEALPALAALIGTLAGVAATYAIAKGRQSGKVSSSDANVLWNASESIRKDLTARLTVVEARLAAVEAENIALRAELGARLRPREGRRD
jgi:hypothetical protein